MKILITGAWGNLGLMCVEQALAAGHDVRCFDLPNKANRHTARSFLAKSPPRIDTRWGDITRLSGKDDLFSDIDGVIHNASVLPPLTETQPQLAYRVNVDGTENLIRLAETAGNHMPFVFPSSVTLFGKPAQIPSIKTVSDKTVSTDHYTRHKLLCEHLLKQSNLNWSILRVGVSVDSRTTKTDPETLKNLLRIHPENSLEYVHPRDVALAMCNALTTPEAHRKTLLIGGGSRCQVTQSHFMNVALASCGLHLEKKNYGNARYYTHWMDTTESQRLLNYQHHSFADYEQEMTTAMKPLRRMILPFRPVANWLLNRWVATLGAT